MIQSMTAFARAQCQHGNATLCWEIKSVNHRYRECFFRLPESLRFLEIPLRQVLNQKCSRGKFDCQLKLSGFETETKDIAVNHSLAAAIKEASQQLAQTHELQNDISPSFLLNWPGVIAESGADMDSLSEPVSALFCDALNRLLTMRAKEGEALHDFMSQRLQAMDAELKKAEQCAINLSLNARIRLLERIDNLKLTVDSERLEQEIALLLTRLDISEELARIKAHLQEVRRVIDSQDSVGRRLDFLMQELNREANTLSSKSDTIELTQTAVEMKVLIEQMREQVQNIE